MRIMLLAFSMILATAVFVTAQQNEYVNPYGFGQQERQEPELRYNPFSSEWSYERPAETLQYNAPENEWSYERPDSELRFNPFENRWEQK